MEIFERLIKYDIDNRNANTRMKYCLFMKIVYL